MTNFDILADYLQRYGLVFKVMPFKTKDTPFETNFNEIEKLLKKENFINYKTIATTDQPYISPILYRYPYYCWRPLIEHYIELKNENKVKEMLKFMKNILIADNFDISFEEVIKGLDLDEKLLKKIN